MDRVNKKTVHTAQLGLEFLIFYVILGCMIYDVYVYFTFVI